MDMDAEPLIESGERGSRSRGRGNNKRVRAIAGHPNSNDKCEDISNSECNLWDGKCQDEKYEESLMEICPVKCKFCKRKY
jgi:hypothetical protein